MRLTLRIPLAILVLTLAACNGAEPAQGPGIRSGGVMTEGELAHWPFWPREMRFHPLTRIVAPAAEADAATVLIEARIEFRDAHEHTARCYGQIRIDLFDAGLGPGAESIDEWNADLRDIAANTLQFDPVTRTYLLRLNVERARLPDHAELRAYFLSGDGTVLRATHRLRTR